MPSSEYSTLLTADSSSETSNSNIVEVPLLRLFPNKRIGFVLSISKAGLSLCPERVLSGCVDPESEATIRIIYFPSGTEVVSQTKILAVNFCLKVFHSVCSWFL